MMSSEDSKLQDQDLVEKNSKKETGADTGVEVPAETCADPFLVTLNAEDDSQLAPFSSDGSPCSSSPLRLYV